MKRRIDLTGRQYGSLKVLEKATVTKKGRFWLCSCECGQKVTVKQSDLKNQLIGDCGYCKDNKFPEAKQHTVEKATKKRVKKPVKGTGCVGVTRTELKSGTRYKATISVEGKNKHLGTFDSLEEAVAARKSAEQLYR